MYNREQGVRETGAEGFSVSARVRVKVTTYQLVSETCSYSRQPLDIPQP